MENMGGMPFRSSCSSIVGCPGEPAQRAVLSHMDDENDAIFETQYDWDVNLFNAGNWGVLFAANYT